jgi:hypothetical protein
MPGYSDYKTKSKGVSYDKIFDIGKSSKLAINLRKGKSNLILMILKLKVQL